MTEQTLAPEQDLAARTGVTGEEWDHWYPDSFEISREGVKAFARAVRSPHIPYRGAAAIPPDSPVPSTMLAAPLLQKCATILSDTIPGCNLSKVMHVSQAFSYHRPLRIGDVVGIGVRATSHLVKAGTDLVTVELGAFVAGRRVLTATVVLAHARGEVGMDIAAMDAASDRIMMAGTGPAESDAYSNALRT